MMSSEFSYDKLKRKLHDDGLKDTLIAAGDLLTRKRFGRPVFDSAVKRGFIKTVSRDELRANAHRTVPVSTPTDEDTEPFVALVGTGRILSETGLALTDRFGIIEESAAEPEQAQQAMMAMLSRELFYGDVPIRRLLKSGSTHDVSATLDTVAPLVPRYPNYYHWMVETVPKIQYLRAFENAAHESVTVLVPANAPPLSRRRCACSAGHSRRLHMQQTRLTPSEIWSYRPIPSDTLQTSSGFNRKFLKLCHLNQNRSKGTTCTFPVRALLNAEFLTRMRL